MKRVEYITLIGQATDTKTICRLIMRALLDFALTDDEAQEVLDRGANRINRLDVNARLTHSFFCVDEYYNKIMGGHNNG